MHLNTTILFHYFCKVTSTVLGFGRGWRVCVCASVYMFMKISKLCKE